MIRHSLPCERLKERISKPHKTGGGGGGGGGGDGSSSRSSNCRFIGESDNETTY